MPDGEGSGQIVVSKSTLVPIGLVFAALLVAVPVVWSLGIQWGELKSDVRRLQIDLASHETDNIDDLKIIDTRLRRLEDRGGSVNLSGDITHEEPKRPDPTQRPLRAVSEGNHLRSQGDGGDPGRPRALSGGSLDGGRRSVVERFTRSLYRRD